MVIVLLVVLVRSSGPEYRAERLYWHAERAADAVMKDPARATPEQAAAALQAFEDVVAQTRGTRPAAKARLVVGMIHAARREFPQARASFERVVRNHEQVADAVLAARVGLARTYEAEGDRPSARAAYREIVDYHPWSAIGLEAPLAMARDAERHGETAVARDTYHFAAAHYAALADQAPSIALALQIKQRLAQAYEGLGEWERALTVMDEVAKARSGTSRLTVLIDMASLAETKLKDPQRAQALYRQIADEYPNEPAGKAAARRLGAGAS